MATKCYSVRLKSLISISDKCFIAKSFDGSEDLIPKSQVFGQDHDVTKSEAYWISSWILSKKTIQYSHKKVAFFNDQRNRVSYYSIETHIPSRVKTKPSHDETLFR